MAIFTAKNAFSNSRNSRLLISISICMLLETFIYEGSIGANQNGLNFEGNHYTFIFSDFCIVCFMKKCLNILNR